MTCTDTHRAAAATGFLQLLRKLPGTKDAEESGKES
jgi:hypothetical protein